MDDIAAGLIKSEQMQPEPYSDYYQYMGQIYYLVKDEETQKMLREDPDMKVAIPALSHLVRTSNITDPKLIREMDIRARRICRLQLMVNKTPNLQSQAKFDAWLIHFYASNHDCEHGWRGKLVTERIKTFKIEQPTAQRGGFFSRLFR